MQSALSLLLLCLLFAACQAELTSSDIVIPPWASVSTLTGVQCSCESSTIELQYSATTTTNSVMCFRYNTTIAATGVIEGVSYNCTCMGRTIPCGITPVIETWTGSSTDCRVYGLNSTSSFKSTYPVCIDALGNSCGELPGVAQDSRTLYANNTGGSIGITCRKDIVRADCTNSICATAPILCQLNETIQPWSSCYAQSGFCVKSRTKPILVNASANAPAACPSVQDRTEYTACTEDECALILCEYEAKEVTGPCSPVCGPAIRNYTIYNISLTPLERCTASPYQYIIATSEVTCNTNRPCSNGSPTQPAAVACESYGNAGYYGANAKGVAIQIGATLQFLNATGSDIASALTITDLFTKRQFPLEPANVTVTTGDGLFYINAEFDINRFDAQGTTGYTFEVVYRQVDGLNISIQNGSVVMPPFRCVTVDRSPPVLLFAMCPPGGTGSMSLVFSEPVTGAGGAPVQASSFTTQSLTITGLTWDTPWFIDPSTGLAIMGVIEVEDCVVASSYIKLNTESVYDANGNTIDTDMGFVAIYEQLGRLISPDGSMAGKMYSSNSSGYIDTVSFYLTAPFLKTAIDKYYPLMSIYYYEYIDGVWTGRVVPISPTRVRYNTTYPANEYVNEIILSIPPLRQLDGEYNDPMSLQADTVRFWGLMPFEMMNPPSILLPTGWSPSDNPYGAEISLVLGTNPSILQAFCFIGQNKLFVVMSKFLSDGLSFSVSNFVYRGLNSIQSIAAVYNRTVIELTMTYNYTYNMISNGDVVTFNGTYSDDIVESIGKIVRWKFINVTVANGTRPSAFTVSIGTATNSSIIDLIKLYFDRSIDPTTFTADSITVTGLQSFSPEYSVSAVQVATDNKSATVNLTATCPTGLCFGTSLASARITLAATITDPYGNPVSTFNSKASLDVAAPRLINIVCQPITKGALTTACELIFSEALDSLDHTLIEPQPVRPCIIGNAAMILCKYPTSSRPSTGSTVYIARGSVIRDLSNNTALSGSEYGVKVQSTNPNCKCSSISCLESWLMGIIIAFGVIGVIGILTGGVVGYYYCKGKTLDTVDTTADPSTQKLLRRKGTQSSNRDKFV